MLGVEFCLNRRSAVAHGIVTDFSGQLLRAKTGVDLRREHPSAAIPSFFPFRWRSEQRTYVFLFQNLPLSFCLFFIFFLYTYSCSPSMSLAGVRARRRHLHRRSQPPLLHHPGGAEEQLQGDGGARPPPHPAGREAASRQGGWADTGAFQADVGHYARYCCVWCVVPSRAHCFFFFSCLERDLRARSSLRCFLP